MEVIAAKAADWMSDIKILKADLRDPVHQRDIVSMMDSYARDPMGDGKPLSSKQFMQRTQTAADRCIWRNHSIEEYHLV